MEPVTINFTVREAAERQRAWRSAPGKEYSEATGERETIKYTGPWSELVALAQQAIDASEDSQDTTCELDRQEGGVCELRVTVEDYSKPSAGAGGEDEGEEGPDTPTEDTLGTQDNPTYTMSSCLVQVPILVHPKFADIAGLELRALKAMLDGQDEYALLDDDAGTGGKRIIDCITSDAGKKAAKYINKGIYYWNDVSTEATARWKGGSNSYTTGTIETPPGGFRAGQGRNWLCSGSGVEKNGGEVWNTASFRMSGPAGWDTYLYSNS